MSPENPAYNSRDEQRYELQQVLEDDSMRKLMHGFNPGDISEWHADDIGREVNNYLEMVSRALPCAIARYRARQEVVEDSITHLLEEKGE